MCNEHKLSSRELSLTVAKANVALAHHLLSSGRSLNSMIFFKKS